MNSFPGISLFKKISILTVVVGLLVTLCYFYIDKPIVYYFYAVDSRKYHWIHLVQQLPELLLILSPLLLLAAFVLKNKNVQPQLRNFLFVTTISVLLAMAVKSLLKFLFGRYWPETFENNNPSLLHGGMYGFHPFHTGVNYSSFPSGHTATIFAFASCIWMIYPRLRWLSVVISLSVFLALLALYYHFLGDLLAGAYVGIVSSILVNELMRKKYAYLC